MPEDNPAIIARGFGAAGESPRAGAAARGWTIFGLALAVGSAAAAYYAAHDLTLSHYDARAHLSVARSVVDSLTPGWRQFGSVWLPLPHIVNLLPAQWDWAYRTGSVATAVSVLTLSGGLALFAATLGRQAALPALVAGALAIQANPNVLYLQATPMTEPMLIGLALAAVACAGRWLREPTRANRRSAQWVATALVLTRYEGWLIAAALASATGLAAGWRRPASWLGLFAPAAAAALIFLVLGRLGAGTWFLGGGFFVPENPARGSPLAALSAYWSQVQLLAGPWLIAGALAGGLVALAGVRRDRSAALPLALLAAGLLPVVAYASGHPPRVRYAVPVVAALGALASIALAAIPAGRVRGRRTALAAVFLAGCFWTRPPLAAGAPMVAEAQWETPFRRGRDAVTRALVDRTRAGETGPILASMGSLAHYLQDLSREEFALRRFVHEGTGDLWAAAIDAPARHVAFALVEERAEGGDVLAARLRSDPGFLAGFDRIAEGGGLALYARGPRPQPGAAGPDAAGAPR